MRRSTALQSEDQPRQLSPLRIWVLCALPWLALVTGLSILRSPACDRRHGVIQRAGGPRRLRCSMADRGDRYTAETIAFYGLLPLGITFVLFVLFLPWAIPWAQGGDYED